MAVLFPRYRWRITFKTILDILANGLSLHYINENRCKSQLKLSKKGEGTDIKNKIY